MPSKPPPSRAGRWFAAALVALVFGGGVLAFAGFSGTEQAAPERGVQGRGVPASAGVVLRKPPRSDRKPVLIPLPPTPTAAGQPAQRRAEVAPPPPRPAGPPPQSEITEEDARVALGQVRIVLYSTQWCGSCRRARDYLSYNKLAYTEYDIDADEEAKERLTKINERTSIPTFQIDDIVQVGFSPENFEYRLNQAVRERLTRALR